MNEATLISLARRLPMLCAIGLMAASTTFPAHAGMNPLTIVVGNGPFAGSYSVPGSGVICVHSRGQGVYSAAWKDFNSNAARSLAEAGVEVRSPDLPGAKYGRIRVSFGNSDHPTPVYEASQVPLQLSFSGQHGEINGQGTTPDGIQLKVTAVCTDTVNM
jgi:hypothetical protein